MTVRYIIQRAVTREVLTYDAPIVAHDSLSRQLSKAGRVDLYLSPDVVTQKASDGRLLYEKYGTLVTIEEDGEIRFRGIVDTVTYEGQDWKISCPSIASYPYGTPFEGSAYYGARVDPADIMRLVWAHVQSYPDSDLGVTVSGSTAVRLGSTSTQKKFDAEDAYAATIVTYNAENTDLKGKRKDAADARKVRTTKIATRTAANKTLTDKKKALTAAKKALTAAKAVKPKNQAGIDAAQAGVNAAQGAVNAAQATVNAAVAAVSAQNAIVDTYQSRIDKQAKIVAAAKAAKDKAYDVKTAATELEREDGGAWTLFWWEAPDCGSSIDDVATATPLDWFEQHYWSGNEPRTRIVVAYPRAGRRLSGPTDPTFEQGVNIAVRIDPTDDGSDYVNTIYGIGAGEGAGSIRRTVTKRDGRLRRSKALKAKSEKKKDALEAKARVELTARQLTLTLTKITVLDHVNSPRGSYGLGDDIRVKGVLPHYGEFDEWFRILGITDNRDGTSELDLARTDSFTFGKGLDE